MLKKTKKILEYAAVILLTFIFSRAEILVKPFGIGYYIAAVLGAYNFFVLSPVILISSFVWSGLWGLIESAAAVAVMGLVLIIRIKTKFKLKDWQKALAALAAFIGVVVAALLHSGVINASLGLVLGYAFSLLCSLFIKAVKTDGLKYRLDEAQVLGGCVMLAVFFLGLSGIEIFNAPIYQAAAILVILVAAKIGGVKTSLITGLCVGLGLSVGDYSVLHMALFAFMAALIGLFALAPKILTALTGVLAYAMFVFYFNVDYTYALENIIALAAGGICFSLIPNKTFAAAIEFLAGSHTRAAVRYMINRARLDCGQRLMTVAEVFATFSDALSGTREDAESDEILGAKFRSSVCGSCEHQKRCAKAKGMDDAFNKLIRTCRHSRPSVSDLDVKIMDNCRRAAFVISEAGGLYDALRRRAEIKRSEEAAKKVISSQMNGVAGILKDMGLKESAPLSYDLEREKVIIEELTYKNIVCGEALVSYDPVTVTLAVKSGDVDRSGIEKILTNILKKKMKVEDIAPGSLVGWNIVYAAQCPKFEAMFGAASRSKDGSDKSGDSHSFIKINRDKFMMALCDGMGSGADAKEVSDKAIGLIENFYHAGFNTDLILDNVNRFLQEDSKEVFTAADIAVTDLNGGVCDIIKIGSPAAYIKSGETVYKIESSSLPLGILDDIKPSVNRQVLKGGDMLVFSSDGVADAFVGDGLAEYINACGAHTPQAMANAVLEEAVKNYGGKAKDDMSVVTMRLFLRK